MSVYISSATALDMLSAHAPRPWCKRLLAYMVRTNEVAVFFRKGRVTDWNYDEEKLVSAEVHIINEVLSEWDDGYWELGAPEVFSYAEDIDWEEGSLRTVEINTNDMDWPIDDHSGENVVYDLARMHFLLAEIEMIAPFAPPPPQAAVQVGTMKAVGGRADTSHHHSEHPGWFAGWPWQPSRYWAADATMVPREHWRGARRKRSKEICQTHR
jgi:hypothetical protein